ncbi:MAG: hypothetical protein MI723_15700 [Caulobacterales bacterium]|nr:hypothetical protein [Caulobacterales bacterium]
MGCGKGWRRAKRDRGHKRAHVDDGAPKARRDRRGSCGIWSYWWLVFPLVFWVIPSLRRVDWAGLGAQAQLAMEGALRLSPVAAPTEFIAAALGVTFVEAYGLVLAAVAVNVAVFALALRGAPRRA